jgi:hypothetical protein
MDQALASKFERIGARVKVTNLPQGAANPRRWNTVPRLREDFAPIRVDIRRDDRGEYFNVCVRPDVSVEVVDVKPADRHLLLMSREPSSQEGSGAIEHGIKSKFLCGHDERSWFVAAIPEQAHAKNVQGAKDALKPAAVWASIREHGVPLDQRDRRRTAAFIRQGEWFFIPRPTLKVNERLVLRNEPIRRGSGKPHMCQFLYRSGGQHVRVSAKHPNGVTEEEFNDLPEVERKRGFWRVMVRDAHVYVKGNVRHADHETVWLSSWHEVVMNTETAARAMQHVAFLD